MMLGLLVRLLSCESMVINLFGKMEKSQQGIDINKFLLVEWQVLNLHLNCCNPFFDIYTHSIKALFIYKLYAYEEYLLTDKNG